MKQQPIKYTQLNVREDTFSIIKWLAEHQQKPKSLFVKEIFEALFDVASQFQGPTIMLVDCHGRQATFTFSGRSVLHSGSFPTETMLPDEEADKMVAEKVDKQFEEEKKHV